MTNLIDRRLWLKQGALAFAGLGFKPGLFAAGIQKPFLPGNVILLNSNENAYGPSPAARRAILESYLSSNRYPDDYIPLLKKRLAGHWQVGEDTILLGGGSSDIIGLACQHVSRSKGHIITADPSYKVWNSQALAFGLSFKRNPLNKEAGPNLEQLYGPITGETRMVYICNPNNPTGTIHDVKALEDFAVEASKQTVVFIDEAYTEYAGLPSLAALAINNRNIIVAKTFSKIYGLAGARVGYAIAHPQTIKSLGSYQPWPDANVSVVSANAALASLDDQTFVEDCREKTRTAREICYAAFKNLSLEYIPSFTNFILFNIDRIRGDFSQRMREKDIYVQFREHYGGKWCRVSMGTIEEMQAFTKALEKIAA
jgi:histidinol-phosphate aminotransferase